jgi:hypothetical protein
MPPFNFRVEGLEHLLKKLDSKLLNKPLDRFFKRAAIRLEAAGKGRAPVDRGRLRNSLTHEIDRSTPPLWAKVGTNVNRGGFPYPLALDEGGITRVYHYRGGGAMGLAGEPTQGWFREQSVQDAKPDIVSYVGDVGADIKREWDSHT